MPARISGNACKHSRLETGFLAEFCAMNQPFGDEVAKLIKTHLGETSYTKFAQDKESSRSGIYRLQNRSQKPTLRQLEQLAVDCNCEFHVIVRPGPIPVTVTIHPTPERPPQPPTSTTTMGQPFYRVQNQFSPAPQ